MNASFYLAWRYLCHRKGRTAILVGSVTLVLYLPLGLGVVVDRMGAELAARARKTPLLVGAKGSALDLTLTSLYFEADPPAPTRFRQVDRIAKTGFADPIPLHVRFSARGWRIVGTTLDYLAFRGLRIAKGRSLVTLGECVLGADVADALKLGPGSTLDSDTENLFDLAGVYPLRMTVVGVLAPSRTPDDQAVFVDLKTAWVIEGLGHGHAKLKADEVLTTDGNRTVANAKVRTFNEITPDNIDSFHFHGDRADFPVTSILAVPHDRKSRTLLMGRYLRRDEPCQIVQQIDVKEDLLATVARVRRFVSAGFLLIGVATAATLALVFLLSLRLRRREMETMRKLGCSRGTVAWLLGAEIGLVLVFAALLASILAWGTTLFGPALLRSLLF